MPGTLPPHVWALTAVFVALLVGLPALAWWETRRSHRRAAALLDSWSLPTTGRADDVDRLQHAGEGKGAGQREAHPVVAEHGQHDGQHELRAGQHEPDLQPSAHTQQVTLRDGLDAA